MKELRIDINGSTRGFQIATDQTKKMARDMTRSIEGYTPDTFKNAAALRQRYGNLIDSKDVAHAHGAMNTLKHGVRELRAEMGSSIATMAAGVISEEAVRQTIEYGAKIKDTSTALGISTDAVQKWGYALKQAGGDESALTTFFAQLAQNRAYALEGQSRYIDSFRQLGVSIDDLKNKRLEDIGMKISEGFKTGYVQKLLAPMKEVGGRGATAMVAAFKYGMDDLTAEAARVGAVIDGVTVDKMKATSDKITMIGYQLRAGFAPIVGFFADIFSHIYDGIARVSAFLGGFSVGGFKGAAAAVQQFDRDKLAAEKKDRPHQSAAEGAAEAEAATNKLESAQKAYRRELENSVNTQTRLLMLLQDQGELQKALAKAEKDGDKVAALQLKTELLQKQREIKSARKDVADDYNKTKPALAKKQIEHIDSLSSMGLISSAGALTNPMIDISRQQLTQLVKIAENTKTKPDPFAP